MTVAVTRTKAEQAYSESFEAVAAKLPGGRAVADARKAAIGAFAGLGFPHRRIEEWKYTDLRSALKEALPPAIADATPVTASRDRSRAGGPGRSSTPTASCSSTARTGRSFRPSVRRRASRSAPLAAALGRSAGDASVRRGRAGPGGRDRAQHRVHDRRGARPHRQGREPCPSRCCWYSSAPARSRASSPPATASGWATARRPPSSRRM